MHIAKKTPAGNLNSPLHSETVGSGGTVLKRLHIKDKKSGLIFLIDTGSDASLVPAGKTSKRHSNELILYATNNSRVFTYGEKHLSLDFILKRNYAWNFLQASVPYPIIGADLLAHYGLIPNLRRRKLIDLITGCSSCAWLQDASIVGVSMLGHSSKYLHDNW